MKLFFFPSCPREGYINPYCIHYKNCMQQFFFVEESKNPTTKMKSLTFFHYALSSDLFVLNWIENAYEWKFGLLQFIFVMLSLKLIKLRRKKIIWMLHNINPHEGSTFFSDCIKKWLFKNASLLVSHSNEAAENAKKRARNHVAYICHPINPFVTGLCKKLTGSCDILIWGSILPYKGIAEFLEKFSEKLYDKKIVILGKCRDVNLNHRIETAITRNVFFQNDFVGFDEIAAYVKKAQYVLFPYIGNCVSSSGALMDTIAMNGGIPVGPNKGAFKDLAQEGVCLTYNSYDELFAILKTSQPKKDFTNFIRKHSWENFAKEMNDLISNL